MPVTFERDIIVIGGGHMVRGRLGRLRQHESGLGELMGRGLGKIQNRGGPAT